MVVGALGGPETFGGQAAALLCRAYGFFDAVEYFDTAEAMLRAVHEGAVDAACIPEQTVNTGFHLRTQKRMVAQDSRLIVYGEVTHAYRCSLLVKPGASLDGITRVIGHTGSVSQSKAWLARHLPHAAIEIVDTNSLGAAETVLAGDGSTASVGTGDAAARVGLTELVTDIDGGSVGNYWAVGERPLFWPRPTTVVVVGRFRGDGELGDLVTVLGDIGFRLQTAYSEASGAALFEHDHVLRFRGRGALDDVTTALAGFPRARLAGAFGAPEGVDE